eukprot:scaffold25495_cov121-Isochrysis_galbana.AAC.8
MDSSGHTNGSRVDEPVMVQLGSSANGDSERSHKHSILGMMSCRPVARASAIALRSAAMCRSTSSKCAASRALLVGCQSGHRLAPRRVGRIEERRVSFGRDRARLRRGEGEVAAVERLGPEREEPGLTQPPVLGWVLRPALHKRLGRADDVRRQRGQRPPARSVVDHPAVGAGRLDRVDGLLIALARIADRARQLVESELVVDHALAAHGCHPVAPLTRDLERVRVGAEEHDARVEEGRPGGAGMVAAPRHAILSGRPVCVPLDAEAVGAGQHVRFGQGVEQPVRRRNPRCVHVGHAHVAAFAQEPHDDLGLCYAVRPERRHRPPEVGRIALGVVDAAHTHAQSRQSKLDEARGRRVVQRRQHRMVRLSAGRKHGEQHERPVDGQVGVRAVGQRHEGEMTTRHTLQYIG